MGIKIELSNADLFNKAFGTIKHIEKKATLNKTKREIGQFFVDKINKNFDNSSDSHGVPWEPLKYRDGKPLILTGKLKKSIKRKNEADGRVVVFTNVFYGEFQNYGTSKIPARPFFPEANNLPTSYYKDLRDIIINNYVKEAKK